MSLNLKSSLERTEVIGRGKFGVVYKGYNKQTKQVVAIKVLNLDTEEDEVIDVQQEIQFLTELKNVPNVTHYYGSFLNDTRLWIIMDYCAGGSVRTLLKCGVFEERYIGVIVRELLIALQAVHKMGFIHRDLKAANVLISKEGNVRLCDFGVATQLTSNALKRTTMAGTPYWMAPEVIREGDTYNAKADIWSLGITLYEIATGNPPYCDKDAMWAMQMISKLTPPRLEGREYSSALKEIVALCLDENPEERLSAEELLKCKFVKFYRSHSTSILKEVITRYLLWRDKNSSRDSVAYMNLEHNLPQADQHSDTSNDKNDHHEHNDNELQVKWDFDSLSSKHYIMENDIDVDQINDDYEASHEFPDDYLANDTYRTESTLQIGNNRDNIANNTIGMSNSINTTYNNGTKSASDRNKSTTTPISEIPKSLKQLFESETSPEIDTNPSALTGKEFELPPAFASNEHRVESPTIEIPDMDSIADFGSKPGTLNSVLRPSLGKPPMLYHSQSASGNLETRSSTSSSTNRPRKLTISNSNSSASHQQPPRTPSSAGSSTTLKTPSPKPVPTAGLLGSGIGNTTSPSKSMKALQSNSNPLLQPINLKSTNETNGSEINSNINSATTNFNQPANTLQPQTGSSVTNPKRSRPGLHIQMPKPSTSINNLAALTHDFELQHQIQNQQNEHVNQFGINRAQVSNLPLSMTPVTEKESLSYPVNDSGADTDVTNLSTQRYHTNTQPKKTAAAGPPSNSNTLASNNLSLTNLFLPRTTSLNDTRAPAKFPPIPSINGEFFLDSTPKHKLVNELDSMIKLFNQGLETLESSI